MRAATVVGCAVLMGASLGGCGSGGDGGADGDIGGRPPPSKARPHLDGSTSTPRPGHHDTAPPTDPPTKQQKSSVEGVALGETLPFGALDVRAVHYRRNGFPAATGT